MTTFNPFPQAAPDFTDPLGLLRACHGRIVGHCDTLERLLTHLEQKGLDAEATEAMRRIHRYFSIAGRHHHDDEEQNLFPLLRGRLPEVDALIDRLLGEHQRMEAAWKAIEPLLANPAQHDPATLAEPAREFMTLYRHHIELENGLLLPEAARLLGSDQLTGLGQAMAERRGVAHG